MNTFKKTAERPVAIIRILSLLGLATLLYIGCAAQPITEKHDALSVDKGSIKGTIRHSITDEGLPNVTVTISGQEETITTDTNGNFLFSTLLKGGYELNFKRDGFEEKSVNLTVAQGGISDGSSKLNQIPFMKNVLLKNITQDGLDVSWETPNTVSSGFVQFGELGSSMDQFSSNSEASTTHLVTLYPLASGTTYQMQVTSWDTLNENYFNTTPVKKFSTGDGTSPRVSNPIVKASSDIATITWSCDRECYPRIYHAVDFDDLGNSVIGSAPLDINGDKDTNGYTNEQTITLSGLKADTTYVYVNESIDLFGESSLNITTQNNTQIFTTAALTAVDLKRIQGVTDTTAHLRWDVITNTDTNSRFLHYRVDGFTASPTNLLATSTEIVHTLTNKDLRAFTATGLTPNTNYWFKVSVVDQSGNTKESTIRTLKTAPNSIYLDPEFQQNPFSGSIVDALVIQGNSDGTNADGFMIGTSGQLARLVNNKKNEWVNINSPLQWPLRAIAGAKDNMVAVGGKFAIHWDGHSWSKIIVKNFDSYPNPNGNGTTIVIDNNFSDVTKIHENDDFILLGEWDAAFRYNSTTGQMLGGEIDFPIANNSGLASHTFRAIDATSGDGVLTVGTNGLIASFSWADALADYTTIQFHETGQRTPAASITLTLNDVSMVDATHGFIVGANGTILRLNGNGVWDAATKESDITTNDGIIKVSAISNTKAYAVTTTGKLLGFDELSSPDWQVLAEFDDHLSSVYFDPNETNGYHLGIVTSKAGHLLYSSH